MHRINDDVRKILFDSAREGAKVDSFFEKLLKGAYDEKLKQVLVLHQLKRSFDLWLNLKS